jgi:hypothetical protein
VKWVGPWYSSAMRSDKSPLSQRVPLLDLSAQYKPPVAEAAVAEFVDATESPRRSMHV